MDTFAFDSVNFDHRPSARENRRALWLMVEGRLPPTLYVGAVLALRARPLSVEPRPGVAAAVAAAVDGARVVVEDIVGKRVFVLWPGAPPFQGRAGAYVEGRAAFRLQPSHTGIPATTWAAFVAPAPRGPAPGAFYGLLQPHSEAVYDPSRVAGAP